MNRQIRREGADADRKGPRGLDGNSGLELGGLNVELESFQLHGRVSGSKRDPPSAEHFGTPLAEVGSGAIS